MPYQSDATKGSAAKSVAERAISMVETRTRNRDPPLCAKTGVCITLQQSHVRDGDTSPSAAVRMAVRNGHLVELTPPERDRAHLGLPTADTFRAAFDELHEARVRAAYVDECEGRARPQYVGALYELLQEVE